MIEDDKFLLISHRKDGDVYWLLPGGGVEYGESLEEALKREFSEELNITIEIQGLAFVCDSIDPLGSRHILNIIFYCAHTGGSYILGDDKRLSGYDFFHVTGLKDVKLFPPINLELIAAVDRSAHGMYIGKMWLG